MTLRGAGTSVECLQSWTKLLATSKSTMALGIWGTLSVLFAIHVCVASANCLNVTGARRGSQIVLERDAWAGQFLSTEFARTIIDEVLGFDTVVKDYVG
jgi:hypothetical protein